MTLPDEAPATTVPEIFPPPIAEPPGPLPDSDPPAPETPSPAPQEEPPTLPQQPVEPVEPPGGPEEAPGAPPAPEGGPPPTPTDDAVQAQPHGLYDAPADSAWAMPASKFPAPEPAVAMAEPEWAKAIPGEPAFPTRSPDGTWSAGGLAKSTLCVDEVGKPRCLHCTPDNHCSGPPNEEMRATMVACSAYIPRGQVQL